ncbi:GPI biosynthesis protein family Pig-F-domain-containing protein, partial [Flagelloscypha sp. PMI_526]
VTIHSASLIFAALFLPRSTLFLDLPVDPSQLSSKDRPQPEFLNDLTRNPIVTLLCLCAGAAALQGWYAGYLRQWWFNAFISGSQDELRLKRKAFEDRKLASLRSAWLATLAASFPFHILSVLFGAPALAHIVKTYLFSLLVAILVIFPPAYIIHVPSLSNDRIPTAIRMEWVRLFSEFHEHWSIPAIGTLIGAWVGIIPIALDWDRPWQAWPLTPAYGTSFSGMALSLFTESWP